MGKFTGTLPYTNGQTSGTVTFTNGKGEISIKHGETVVIKNVEYGLSYNITEQTASIPEYTVTYEQNTVTVTGNAAVQIRNRADIVLPTGVRIPVIATEYLLLLLVAAGVSFVIIKKKKT